MAKIGIVVHRGSTRAADLANEAIDWLRAGDHTVALPVEDAALLGRPELGRADEPLAGLDLAVGIGGDGTMLRAVHLAAAHGVPVLGVNVGQLGYLTEVEPQAWAPALKRFLAGDYELEDRMMLSVVLHHADGTVDPAELSLNEAVMEKDSMGHTVRLRVEIDGAFFTTYQADGFIVATPTGSTAYSLSAHGPVVAPRHQALLLTPVCPHGLFDRSLVLAPDAHVRLEVCGHRPASLAVDGRHQGRMEVGDAIECTAAERPAQLVTFGERNVHLILKSKFGLNDR
jgi:NAD+ kinase